MVLWAKRFLPQGPFTEPRGRLESSEDELAAFAADFGEGADVIARRRVLSRLLVGAFAALGVAALFPIRSLGPRPGRGLKTTPFRAGVRLVDEENEPLQPDELPVDAVLTVWPEGHVNAADAPTLLINLRPTADSDPANTGFVAYSKLCTHMGCPVGLFQAELGLLLCPCHQSTFDVYQECKPVFGPATRALPRLPIGVDDEGFFEALGDFDGPVGPGFWDRGR
jgi:ubiquinol-cytochrome c reductase iron-sulfur subunit